MPQTSQPPMCDLLITGGTGYLGSALLRQAQAQGLQVAATYFRHAPTANPTVRWLPLDVRDALSVEEALDTLRPRWVIHTAFQQAGPDLMATTGDGAGHVAQAAATVGARLIHISSDVIFDGERDHAYTEADPPAPISAYGSAKARAEELVATLHPAAVRVRTSLIYGFDPIDKNTQFVLDVAQGRVNAQLFTDEYRCPVFVEDLAAALLELAALDYTGVLNLAGTERISRYAFGVLLAQAWSVDPAGITPGLSSASGMRRPRNCTLDCTRANSLLRTRLRGVRTVLADHGRLPLPEGDPYERNVAHD